jgi:hypothetical protein
MPMKAMKVQGMKSMKVHRGGYLMQKAAEKKRMDTAKIHKRHDKALKALNKPRNKTLTKKSMKKAMKKKTLKKTTGEATKKSIPDEWNVSRKIPLPIMNSPVLLIHMTPTEQYKNTDNEPHIVQKFDKITKFVEGQEMMMVNQNGFLTWINNVV